MLVGRPNRRLHAQRVRLFLEQVIGGARFDDAAREAGLSDKSALRLLADLGAEGVAALIQEEAA